MRLTAARSAPADLTADLPSWELRRVDVRVGAAGADEAQRAVKVAGGQAVVRVGHHIRRRDGSAHAAGRGAGGLAAATAQKDDDGAIYARIGDMNVGEQGVTTAKAAEAQRVERGLAVHQGYLELAVASGSRRGNLL